MHIIHKVKNYLKSTPIWKLLVGGAGLLISLLVLGIIIFFFAVKWGLFGKLPTADAIQDFQNNTASEIYSADSVLLGKYYTQDRTDVSFGEISSNLINALIATEDVRFYEHHGVDRRSIFRVAFKTLLLMDESSGGGSTITQQLAKNIYPRENIGILTLPVAKIKEIITATRIEEVYSKEEIITLYLNTVPFGENAFGIEAASERYFSSSPADLTVEQAAVLVGMLKATTTYNPRKYPERSAARRNVVLSQMVKYGFLSPTLADSLKKEPIQLEYKYLTHNEGLATYFRAHLRQELLQWCATKTKPDGTPYNLYTDGLKIYTTLNATMQSYAEEAVKEQMSGLQKQFYAHWKGRRPWYRDEGALLKAIYNAPRYQQLKEKGLEEEEIQEIFKQPVEMKIYTWEGEKEVSMSPLDSVKHYLYFLNAGFMAMDPRNGHVKAWVGGIDHKYFKYDHVNKQTKRQVGSTFKPIVYAAALESGVQPCDYIPNERKVYEQYENWSPRNSNDQYEGLYSMEGALTQSVNTISVQLIMETGPEKVVDLAHNMGISSNIKPVPSIALGTANISLFEMVGAYSTFANEGTAIVPTYLLRIEDKYGNVLEEYEPTSKKRALSKSSSIMIREMLKNVVNKGTASSLRYKYGLANDIAGKTGTTQSHADGWFIGVTPELVAGAWVGADDPRIHFRTIQYGQGAQMALPIWGKFMQKINQDKQFGSIRYARFPRPPMEIVAALDCEPFIEEEEKNLFDLWPLFGKNDQEQKERKVRQRTNTRKYPTQKKKKNIFDKIGDLFK